jgi:hypothetical protein
LPFPANDESQSVPRKLPGKHEIKNLNSIFTRHLASSIFKMDFLVPIVALNDNFQATFNGYASLVMASKLALIPSRRVISFSAI